MTTVLDLFIVVANEHDEAPELRCDDHPDWWADADAERLPTVIRRAVEHLRDAHRTHVDKCACRERVSDSRCMPRIDLLGVLS